MFSSLGWFWSLSPVQCYEPLSIVLQHCLSDLILCISLSFPVYSHKGFDLGQTSTGSLKKQETSRKTSLSALLAMSKPLTVCITVNCGKFWKRWEYRTTWPAYWETYMQVRKQQLEPDMEQQTGSKSEKEYVKAVYCHPAYLTYMQRTSWETLGWKKYKLESRLLGEISITSGMQMTPPYGRKWRSTKEPLDESERGEWKSWIKAQHSEN